MKQIMLDLETLSTKSDGAIVSIGAVDINNLDNKFHEYIAVEDAMAHGSVSAQTLRFWMQEAANGNQEAMNIMNGTELLGMVLIRFYRWVQDVFGDTPPRECKVWANYSAFDFPKLENAFEVVKVVPHPWEFWQQNDIATLLKLCPEVRDVKNGHNAVDDAVNQARWLHAIHNAHPDLGIIS